MFTIFQLKNFHSKFQGDVEPNVEPIPNKRWEIIKDAWSKNIQSTQEFVEAILTYNPEYAKSWKFEALHNIFDRVCDNFFILVLITK